MRSIESEQRIERVEVPEFARADVRGVLVPSPREFLDEDELEPTIVLGRE
ncbi:hypothetical protein [Prauserella cavernicola]|uniref:Uncharacterized protein n=1 Tax=Prauserella cavernicola TaxID=2800127 RepID=A0A934V6R7_9PSEU|nr:hypothetical protein [Prauserella cavernicola]MBK1786969.1 hypothetical protein [Prauserella cavernicola]